MNASPRPHPRTVRVVRLTIAVAGCALLVNAGWLAVTANLSLGTFLTALAGLAALGWAAAWHRLVRSRLAVIGTIAVLVVIASISTLLAVTGSRSQVDGQEQAVIVLGAAVHGQELSTTLRARLDRALEFHSRDPQAWIVVSGGQGAQEDLPEAVAMQRYLVSQGVDPAKILVEDRATSTDENFRFSRRLLQSRVSATTPIAFVTDDYHCYRAGRLAAASGLVAHQLPTPTNPLFWPANYLREIVAVLASWFGR